MKKKKVQFEVFGDGVTHIFKMKDMSEPGDRPCLKPVLYHKYGFDYKTIGSRRKYDAMQAEVQIDEMISIPMDREIHDLDIFVICGQQFEVKQIQHKQDTKPATSLVSLFRMRIPNEDIEI